MINLQDLSPDDREILMNDAKKEFINEYIRFQSYQIDSLKKFSEIATGKILPATSQPTNTEVVDVKKEDSGGTTIQKSKVSKEKPKPGSLPDSIGQSF